MILRGSYNDRVDDLVYWWYCMLDRLMIKKKSRRGYDVVDPALMKRLRGSEHALRTLP
jgi:hypothetical protein